MVLVAVSARVHRSEGGAVPPPSSGRILPYDSTLRGPARTLGVLTGAHLDQVIDVTTAGDTVFVLAPRGWRVLIGRRVLGPFGAPDAGPQGLARARRIAIADSGVYVLDAGRRDVSRWTRTGRLVERFPIGMPTRPLVPQDLAVGARGEPVVVVQEITRTASRWVVLRLVRDAAPVTALRAPAGSSLFTQPRIAAGADDFVLVDPLTHALTWLSARRRVPRTEAPVWPTPDSLRARFAERAGRIGVRTTGALDLPDSLPSVHAFAVAADGRMLTAINPIGDHVLVEVFARDGAPLGRMTPRPLPPPSFLTPAGVVLVREEPATIRFTLLPIGR
jgi:hypothetical protein